MQINWIGQHNGIGKDDCWIVGRQNSSKIRATKKKYGQVPFHVAKKELFMIKFTYVAPLAPMVVSAVEDHFHISHGIEANAFLGCPQALDKLFCPSLAHPMLLPNKATAAGSANNSFF
jgi:hypothetical protein